MNFDKKMLILSAYLVFASLAMWSEGKSVILKKEDHTDLEAALNEYSCKGLYGETVEETIELL